MRPPSYRQRLFVEHDLGGSLGSAVEAVRRAGYPWTEQMSRKMLRNVEKRGVHAARNGAGSNFGSVADIRTEIHGPWLIRSRFTCDPPPTDLPILGLFSIEIPGFSVLKCYLPMTKAKPVWLCFGAFPSLPTPFLRIHRPPGTLLSSLPVHPGRSPPAAPSPDTNWLRFPARFRHFAS